MSDTDRPIGNGEQDVDEQGGIRPSSGWTRKPSPERLRTSPARTGARKARSRS